VCETCLLACAGVAKDDVESECEGHWGPCKWTEREIGSNLFLNNFGG
jgi:hypothetical protein